MIDEVLLRALAAGVGVAVICGAVGCFLVWRRMAFYGDTLSHSALLGVAAGLIAGISPAIGALVVCLLVAASYAAMQSMRSVPSDTLLAVIAHGSLAAGLIAITVLAPGYVNVESYLFGDLLAIGDTELATIYAIGMVVALCTGFCWRAWLAISVDEELARVEGVAVARHKLLQMLVMASLVAVAMNVVGALLVTALLVIPPAAARAIARSPEQVALFGAGVGALSVIGGLMGSWHADSPAGPSVVMTAVALFGLLHVFSRLKR